MTPKTAAIVYIVSPIITSTAAATATHAVLNRFVRNESIIGLVTLGTAKGIAGIAAWTATTRVLEPLYQIVMNSREKF